MSQPSFPKLGRHGILALSTREAEWLEYDSDGSPRYACRPVEGDSVAELVRSALAARDEAGGRSRRVILALRDGLVRQRIVSLPPLGRRELARVLARKAAGEWEEGEDSGPPLYWAREQARIEGEESSNWILVSLQRSRTRELALALRRGGVNIRRTTACGLATLDRAAEFQSSEGEGTICVAVGRSTIKVSLICDGELFGHEVLEGNLLEAPQLVPSLLQSVKTTAGFWRKTRRGAGIGDVVVLGLNPDRGQLLRNAIAIALPSTRVCAYPALPEEGSAEPAIHPAAGRISMLEAAGLGGPFAPALDIPLPMRRGYAATGAALLVAASVSAVGLVHREVDERVATIEADVARTREVTRELGELEREESRSAAEVDFIACSLRRLSEVEQSGLELEPVCAALFRALSRDAELSSLNIGRVRGAAREVELRATSRGHGVEAVARVGRLQRELEAVPGLREVHIDLPTRVGHEEDSRPLEFTVRASLEVTP